MDNLRTLDALSERLKRFRDERDWAKFHSAKNLAISVSVEAAELLEIFQWSANGHAPSPNQLSAIEDEAADVMIYLLMLCDGAGIDLLQATHAKIDRNEKRFPVSPAFSVTKSQNKEE